MPESYKKYRLNIWYQSVEPARLLLGYVPYIKQKGRRGFQMVDNTESEHQTCGNKHVSFGCFGWSSVEVLLSFCKREPKSHTTPLPVLCRIEFHMGFSPLLTQHETTTMRLSDQVGSQELKVKLGSLKESKQVFGFGVGNASAQIWS